jgi:hypothetical protein
MTAFSDIAPRSLVESDVTEVPTAIIRAMSSVVETDRFIGAGWDCIQI